MEFNHDKYYYTENQLNNDDLDDPITYIMNDIQSTYNGDDTMKIMAFNKELPTLPSDINNFLTQFNSQLNLIVKKHKINVINDRLNNNSILEERFREI